MKKVIVPSLLAVAGLVCLRTVQARFVDTPIGYTSSRQARANGLNQNGVSASIAFNFNRWLDAASGFGTYRGPPLRGYLVNINTLLSDARLTPRYSNDLIPFVQAMGDGAHLTAPSGGLSGSSTSFALSLGDRADLGMVRHVAIVPTSAQEREPLVFAFADRTGTHLMTLESLETTEAILWAQFPRLSA